MAGTSETIKMPFGVYRCEETAKSVSLWELEKELLEMYHENPEMRPLIEEFVRKLGMNMGFAGLRKTLQIIEEFEKEDCA